MVMPPVLIDADDRRGDARQHRLDEAAALVDLVLGLEDLARCWVRISEIILLNVRDRLPTSPSAARTGTTTSRLPVATLSAAPISWRIGRTMRSATAMAVQMAASSTISAKPR